MELKFEALVKDYGKKRALDHLSFVLREGVHGLIGPNGAGKSTMMNILSGNLAQTAGRITFNGEDIRTIGKEFRKRLGSMPQQQALYPGFTAAQFLGYMATLRGLEKAEATDAVHRVLRQVELEDVATRKIKTFSGGMKQRLGIAQALLNNPKMLILDEPTAGLDPKERVRFRNLIGQLGKDSIVLLSTHIVSDIEHIADEVLMMKDGALIYHGAWDEQKGDLESFYLAQFEEGGHE